MHLLTTFSLKNRALIALVTIVAAVFGVIGVGSLKQELMPSVQFPAIAVVTSYQGAAPEVVNADVSGPIETALRGVPQLESTMATSSTGASMVLAQFTYGVDLAVTEQKVERAIGRISSLLPASTDTQVLSGSIDDFPVIQIAVTPAEGQTPEEAAALVANLVTPKLADLDGVRDAQLSGARVERVVIRPDLAALAAAGLSPQALTDTLQQSGVLIAGGTVTDGDQTLAVQAGSTVTTVEEIAALPIPGTPIVIPGDPNVPVNLVPGVEAPVPAVPQTIGTFARVAMEQAPETSISRINGQPALSIGITKVSSANTVEVSHAVQDEMAALSEQLEGAQMSIIFDQAPYIEDSVETLTTEGLLGLLFAVLVILVFLMSVRATLVTAISIPVSVLLTFIGLNAADYTLNMLTLGALTISIGRVVDDSIVVIENIKRHFAEAEARDAANDDRAGLIVRAVREVAGAITASTATTVAVFLPMAFVSGMVGELFRPFAFTVTIALIASLLVSLTIVPVLAYWFLRAKTVAEPGKVRVEATTVMQRGYRPLIVWTLARPAVTLIAAALILGATVAATPLMKTNFIGADGQNSVGLVQTLEPGTSLEAQLAQAERVEEVLDGIVGVESVQVTIGSGGSPMSAMMGGGSDGAVNYSVNTAVGDTGVIDDIRAAVEALDDAGAFSVSESGAMPGMSSSIAVSVAAPKQETLVEASEAVLAALKEQPELSQVESDLGQSRPYLAVTVNRELAAQAGVSEAAVAGQMAQQMQPQQIGQITRDATVTSVFLVANEIPTDAVGVGALPIQTPQGIKRLDELAMVAPADGPVAIHTADGARTVTVSALPVGDDLGTASTAVTAALKAVDLPGGATAEVGGVMSQQEEAFQQLGIALLAAILIVYIVMVATFRSLLQPLLLLASVPFAATGALLLLLITGIPLGVPSLIGVLMLIGVVVTNAIVLVDLVNQYRERGDSLYDAVLHGTLQRLRPIVMTALATILALTPMALGITGHGGFISQPLAVVVIGGLLSSTVLTLIVLPTLYYAVERLRERGDGHGGRDGAGNDTDDDGGDRRGKQASRRTRTATLPVLTPGGLLRRVTAAESDPVAEPRLRRRGGADFAAGVVGAAGGAGAAAAAGSTVGGAGALGGATVAPPTVDSTPAEVVPEPLGSRRRPVDIAGVDDMTEPVPTATAEMSLALENLGFVGEQNPLVDVDVDVDVDTEICADTDEVVSAVQAMPADPTPEAKFASDIWDAAATNDLPPLVLPEPQSAPEATVEPAVEPATSAGTVTAPVPAEPVEWFTDEAASESESESESAPAANAEQSVSAEPSTLEAPAVLSPLSAPHPDAPPAPVAPPITGELNWEQLMWEATQETDQFDPNLLAGAGSDTAAAIDAAADTYPAERSDRADDTGSQPGEER